eukprot:Nitzschia sp. Nitz4//scaffold79_size90958//44915//46354//NITZ4_005027-RA/size90958-processed-gene-0.91-mRNA-1//1//CDS//3329558255//3084//frame0
MIVSPQHTSCDDWQLCHACGKPPLAEQNLLRCHNCQSAFYHDANCQRKHWKEHKRVCNSMKRVFAPLTNLLKDRDTISESCWWESVSARELSHSDNLWQINVQRWRREDYLNAMQGFQQALEPFQQAWEGLVGSQPQISSFVPESLSQSWYPWACRLLFCAYCEMDAQNIPLGRDRLLQCLSLLLASVPSDRLSTIPAWSDAWMELMLSMEEIPEQRVFARNLAYLALSSGLPAPCGWVHPLQRPGYMVLISLESPQSISPAFIPRESHPSWCRSLEDHFPLILEEYRSLTHQRRGWSSVGSGSRGSGHDDHRVVVGQDWSEWVLFGTGAQVGEAPRTRELVRRLVPDAVSLAEEGGGEVIFSRLAPHTRIQSHCGTTNFRWTAHLGLIVPVQPAQSESNTPICGIRVSREWNTWEPGKILLFDDSYEHEVVNDSDYERVVLLLRLWHPELHSQFRGKSLFQAREHKEEATDKRYNPPL